MTIAAESPSRDRRGNPAERTRPQLLVSVRSPLEVEPALLGGADLIDVKEPSHGSLGRPEDRTVEAVLDRVGSARPVSAALGELLGAPDGIAVAGLRYAKWGLAGCSEEQNWRTHLGRARRRVEGLHPECRAVAVVYADWQRARAPAPHEVCTFARCEGWTALLFDTWRKDGSTLLDWLPPPELGRLCVFCQEAGVRVAFAGSLQLECVPVLQRLRPDWIAVRQAVCAGGNRGGSVDASLVRSWAVALAEPFMAATLES